MKSPVKWHENCLKNSKLTMEGKIEEYNRLRMEIFRLKEEIAIYEEQIYRANKEGRDGFDRDKFNLKK